MKASYSFARFKKIIDNIKGLIFLDFIVFNQISFSLILGRGSKGTYVPLLPQFRQRVETMHDETPNSKQIIFQQIYLFLRSKKFYFFICFENVSMDKVERFHDFDH